MILTMGLMFADFFGYNFGMKDAAGFVVFFDLGSIFTAWSLREHLRWSFLLVAGVPWTLCDLLGAQVLVQNDSSPWLKPAFGGLLFIVLLTDAFEVWRKSKQAKVPVHTAIENRDVQGDPSANVVGHQNCDLPPVPMQKETSKRFDVWGNWKWCVLFGITGGLLKGLFTVPMPALVVFLLFSGIDKDTWRANLILLNIFGMATKGYYLFYAQSLFEVARIPQYAATTLGVLAATPVGNFLAKRLDKERFKDIVRLFAFTGGSSMVATAAESQSLQLWCSFTSLLLGVLTLCCRWRKRPLLPEGEEQELQGLGDETPKGAEEAKV